MTLPCSFVSFDQDSQLQMSHAAKNHARGELKRGKTREGAGSECASEQHEETVEPCRPPAPAPAEEPRALTAPCYNADVVHTAVSGAQTPGELEPVRSHRVAPPTWPHAAGIRRRWQPTDAVAPHAGGAVGGGTVKRR